jgi:hypothetical protein
MICSLCLKKIENNEDLIYVKLPEGTKKARHKLCHNELEEITKDLDKIYRESDEN